MPVCGLPGRFERCAWQRRSGARSLSCSIPASRRHPGGSLLRAGIKVSGIAVGRRPAGHGLSPQRAAEHCIWPSRPAVPEERHRRLARREGGRRPSQGRRRRGERAAGPASSRSADESGAACDTSISSDRESVAPSDHLGTEPAGLLRSSPLMRGPEREIALTTSVSTGHFDRMARRSQA